MHAMRILRFCSVWVLLGGDNGSHVVEQKKVLLRQYGS